MVSAESSATREKILSAGLSLFSSRGFIGTTTRELAKEAGVAEITLFRHFPTKEKLLEEVITNFSLIPELKALQPKLDGQPLDAALLVLAKFLFSAMVARKEWIVLMQSEVRRDPGKLLVSYHVFLDRVYTIIADFFRSQQADGVMRTCDPELAARAFYGMIFSYFNTEEVLQRKHYRPTNHESAVASFVDFFTRGLSSEVEGVYHA